MINLSNTRIFRIKNISYFMILVLCFSVNLNFAFAKPVTKLRQAKATVLIKKNSFVKKDNSFDLIPEIICKKDLIFDVVDFEHDEQAEYDPASVECDSKLKNNETVTLKVTPLMSEVYENNGQPEYLIPANKRFKQFSSVLQVTTSMSVNNNNNNPIENKNSKLWAQNVVSTFFVTEDLNLKTGYLFLQPEKYFYYSVECGSDGQCYDDISKTNVSEYFTAAVRFEDFYDSSNK